MTATNMHLDFAFSVKKIGISRERKESRTNMEPLWESRVSATFILHNNCLPEIICDSAWTCKCAYKMKHIFN